MASMTENTELPKGIDFGEREYLRQEERANLQLGNEHDLTWKQKCLWKGKVLFISLNSNDNRLEEIYKNAILEHNLKVDQKYADSGFDLYLPNDFCPEKTPEKVDYNIKTAMFSSLEGFLSSSRNSIPSPFIVNGPSPFYLYPRSSIAKTQVRLANNVGIIDSGYRGNIGAFFDILDTGFTTINPIIILEKYQRVVQICANDLSPFKVILVKYIDTMGQTERGTGGFGSTGI